MNDKQNELRIVLNEIHKAEDQVKDIYKCLRHSAPRKIRIDCGSYNAGVYDHTMRLETDSRLMSSVIDGMRRAIEDDLDSLRKRYKELVSSDLT